MITSILKRKPLDSLLLLLFFCSVCGVFKANGQYPKVDSLLIELGQLKSDTSKIIVFDELSNQLYNTISESGKAIEYAKEGLKLANKIAYEKYSVSLLSMIGIAYINLSEYDSAAYYLEECLDKAKQKNNEPGEASAYENLGVVMIHRGENETALNYFRKAMHIYQKENLISKIAQTNIWFGNVYKDTHQLDSAIYYFQQSLDYYLSVDDIDNAAIAQINLSSIFRMSKQYEQAVNWAHKSADNFKKSGNKNGVGISLYRLALAYSEMNDLERSESALLEAKTIFGELNNEYFLNHVYSMLGYINNQKGEYQFAINFYNEFLTYSKKTNQPTLIGNALFNIGNALYGYEKYDEALFHFLSADSIFVRLKNHLGHREVLHNTTLVYSRMADHENVDKYMKLYENFSDSIFSEKVASSVADMQVKYETLEKEKDLLKLKIQNEEAENNILMMKKQEEISSLTLQQQISDNILANKDIALKNADIEKQRAQIRLMALQEQQQNEAFESEKYKHSLQTKAYILAISTILLLSLTLFLIMRNRQSRQRNNLERKALELNRQLAETSMKAIRSQLNPHFIFNCVHTIEALLLDSQTDQSLSCLKKFSSLTRLVLENSQKKEIPLSDEIDILKLYMDLENTRFKIPFSYTITVDREINPETTMVPPLVFQPFVENSIKHGFADKNKPWKLNVNIHVTNGMLLSEIVDNGIGRIRKMEIPFQSGFKKESLGLKLVEQRLTLMNEMKKTSSSFEVIDLLDDQQKPTGTKVTITLPYELAV